jgi:hypothetical protein
VALGALDRQPEPDGARRRHAVDDRGEAELLDVDPTLLVRHRVPVEPGGDAVPHASTIERLCNSRRAGHGSEQAPYNPGCATRGRLHASGLVVALLPGSEEPSLTQNTDRYFSCEIYLYFFVSTSCFKFYSNYSLPHFHQAPTLIGCYLLKNLSRQHHFPPSAPRCRIVLFVSSREMKLCSTSCFPSTALLENLEVALTLLLLIPPCFRDILPRENYLFLHRVATGGELYQRLRKLGKRFSTNAAIPSF